MLTATLAIAALIPASVPTPASVWTRSALQSEPGAQAIQASENLALIRNDGQWPLSVQYVGSLGPLVVRLQRDALELQLRQSNVNGVLVRLEFDNVSAASRVCGLHRRPEHYGYFIGNEPSHWQRAVPAFEQAIYRDLWMGVDLVVRAERGSLKYDVVVAPGASLNETTIRLRGAESMHIDSQGALVIQTSAGPIRQPAPISYQVLPDGERRFVDARYRILEGERFDFQIDARDSALPLVIDPGLIWSTYLGSSSVENIGDWVQAIALGPNNEAIVAGVADWGDFPVTPGTYSSPFVQDQKAFVSVFEPSGSALVYSCIIGGNQPQFSSTRALAVGLDATNHVIVAGWTQHTDFPTTPGAFDTVKQTSARSGFVVKFEPDGSDLVYSTFLDGSQSDKILALAVAPGGSAIVGGETASLDFPTTSGAFDTTFGSSSPGFLTRLDPLGSRLEWSTFLGASADVRLSRRFSGSADGRWRSRTARNQGLAAPIGAPGCGA